MKKDKGFVDDREPFSWEDLMKDKESESTLTQKKEEYEWDRPLVDESWTIDNTDNFASAETTDSQTGIKPGSVTALLPSEDAIYNAMLREDMDLSVQLSESLSKVMENNSVDEKAIRSSVDKKIVIKSEELKSKRVNKDGTPRKVRRRIPKNSSKYKPLAEENEQQEIKRQESRHQNPEPRKSGEAHRDVKEMSDFRRKSMNWKEDGNNSVLGGELDEPSGHGSGFIPLQWVSIALAIIIVLSAAMTSAVYASYKSEQNRALALKTLEKFADTTEYDAGNENFVEENLPEETAQPEEAVVIKTLSLVLTSVEKDLKIKLVDQDDTLVKGVSWGVTVTDENGRISDNDDEDKDGVIYLTEISAGDYSVELKSSPDLADYILPQSAQLVSVKAKIEYKVIANIKDEIKTEKEVNAAVEDNGNKAADVETGTLTDTVEWVESTKTKNGEEYVPSEVYLAYTAAKDTVKNYFAMALDNLSKKINGRSSSVIGMPMLVASEEGTPALTGSSTENGEDGDGNTSNGELSQETPEEPTPTPEPEVGQSVTFDKSEIVEGETATASISIKNLEGYTVEWTSSDYEVVSVQESTSSSVTVTAGSKAGTATITANITSASFNASRIGTIKVIAKTIPVSEIKLDKSEMSVLEGSSQPLKAAISPGNATTSIVWETSDSDIATVEGSGLEVKVNGIKSGSATITATTSEGGKKATCKVTVVRIKKITLTPKELSVAVKSNYQIGIAFDPAKPTDTTVTWKSEDKNIATVSDGGLVTGVKEGTTKITVTANDGSGIKAECKVTVTAEENYADSAQLYDKDKNPLYRKDGDKYVLANYKDYKADKTIKLYKKTDGYLYTGWQTIDGKTYYYKRDNTYVTGDQVIGGVTYHFATDGSLTQGSGTLGIDVSKYQPSINWSSVKASGVGFVIIRCGYRGSSTGVLVQDPYFVSHIKGAKAAGLKVGVYFFTTALNETEAIEEASMCAYLCKGYGIDYPVFMDCESSNRPGYNQLSSSQRTQIIQAFCNTLKSAGYTPGVYANKTWLTEKMNASALSGYKIWLAQYNAAGPTYTGRYDLWQYTSKGTVSGISGNVDMNQSYLGY